ncbi:membrane protein insertase YidC [Marivirga sp. S37H4]|uniref:Membrane protein insertase YidC n=1 Tax=Marivirga aurantiaca TaxID=2802615 RepID=A0A935C6Y1_9BACT|nr:membrane protein insertase YidC [Marivirga aurantiaca]MBK6264027.1 membrane protein insertase YidC [Marivirga aurantiaca]
MEKNQATGLILISILLIAYFWFFADAPGPVVDETNDQTEQVESPESRDTSTLGNNDGSRAENLESDSLINESLKSKYGVFASAANGTSELITFNTDVIEITFDKKGGIISQLELKNFETYDGQPLVLAEESLDQQQLIVNAAVGAVDLYELNYELVEKPNSILKAGDTSRVVFKADFGNGRSIEQIYTLSGSHYEVGYELALNGFQNEIIGENFTLIWNKKMRKFEKDLTESRRKATINYYSVEDGMDYLSESADTDEEILTEPIQWFSFKQNFFNSALITDIPMQRAHAKVSQEGLSDEFVKDGEMKVEIALSEVKDKKGEFKFYYGPNNYKILQTVAADFEENIYLGWFPISLVNKYVIINVFHVLEKYISNYGIIIIILVFLIKLALSPLSYKSYVSMAKTKVLKPQLDEIKEKHGGDMQKAQAEQMQLYQKVGVNPLSGCIPLLLQMPILFAMFYFFPSSIELRQEAFLWANDLSTYDSIATLPFTIPFYGNHVSLFTILMTLSTLLITWSQGQVSSVQGPMKNIQYIMPVVFMFVLNSFAAALSFYYFVANIITYGQQALIRKMIDEDKIKQILEENKKKNVNKKTSKFQQRLQEAMKASEEAKKNKSKKSK